MRPSRTCFASTHIHIVLKLPLISGIMAQGFTTCNQIDRYSRGSLYYLLRFLLFVVFVL